MARGWGRVALGAALLAGVPVALAVPPAVAASTIEGSAQVVADGPCDGDSGVTVVVDFGTLAGGVQTRCALEPVSSGFEALEKAGFTYEGTTRFQGLLCRIDGKPSPQQDPCHNAPSPSYYWAYWTASAPGGAWTYSDMGAGNRDPAPGSVEGWAFSDGCTRKPGAPTTCPSATTTTTATPTTTTRPSTSGGGTGGSGGSPSVAAPAASGLTTVSAAAGGSASVDVTATTDGGPALPSADDAHREGRKDDVALGAGGGAAATDPASTGGGSPAGVLAGAAVVLLLGLGAAARQRQRGRSSPSGSGAE